MYKIEVKASVVKAFKKVPREDQIRIAQAIKALAIDPRPQNSIKLSGSTYYRIRCGDYRIIYDIKDDQLIIVVLKLGHRKDVYK